MCTDISDPLPSPRQPCQDPISAVLRNGARKVPAIEVHSKEARSLIVFKTLVLPSTCCEHGQVYFFFKKMTVDGKSGSWQLSRSAHASSQQPDRWAATPSPSSSGDRQWPRAVRGAGDGAGPPAVRQRPRVRQRRPGGGPVPVAERRPAEGALLVRPSQASSRAPQPSSLVSPENKFITTTRRDRQTSPPHLSAQIWVAKGRQKVQNEPSQISLNRICGVWYSLCLSSPKPWNLSLLLCISPVLCSLPCICVCVFFCVPCIIFGCVLF